MSRKIIPWVAFTGLAFVLGGIGGCSDGDGVVCFGNGLCMRPDGTCFDGEGRDVCCGQNCDPSTSCTCPDLEGDADHDCIPDALETRTDPTKWDTDGDGRGDGCEDTNRDGQVDPGETDPAEIDSESPCTCPDLADDADDDCIPDALETRSSPNKWDTDGDGLGDGCEDVNRNGQVDPGETDATKADTDGDGVPDSQDLVLEYCTCPDLEGDADHDCIPDALETRSDPGKWDTDGDGVGDGCEDRNRNGQVDPGEMDPTLTDTDGDGIPDGAEDANRNGRRDVPAETSGVNDDSDGDGIKDGDEDRNQNGVVDPWVDSNGNGCWDPGEPGEGNPRSPDSDGDLISDRIEDADHDGLCDPGETCFWHPDTDCDGLRDGAEDNGGTVGRTGAQNGVLNTGETDPHNPDTDGDGIKDGVEDANGDGSYDPITETNPLSIDSDGDGILDSVEDRNKNGIVDGLADGNLNGCFDEGEVEGESDPRKYDSDGDGIPDGVEDVDRDGYCATAMLPPRSDPSGAPVRTFLETCAYLIDTDCDGLSDGIEDLNANGGAPDLGETDPRDPDTDLDGLWDGCHPSRPGPCEDKDNDGVVAGIVDSNLNGRHDPGEPGETDPLAYDTDADGLSDGCELSFAGGPTDPLEEDSDGDGELDGEEDADHNCQVDAGETDPRVVNAAPPEGTRERAQFNVCAAQNLKELTYAVSPRPELDYRLAFEVERNELTSAEARYIVLPFGKDNDGNGFDPASPADTLYGHVFQSPAGVVDDPSPTVGIINRNVYGFILASEDVRPLDDMLDALRNTLATAYPDGTGFKGVEETGAIPSRPSHDDLPKFSIRRAQRQLRIRVDTAVSANKIRNDILVNTFLGGVAPDPRGVPSPQDPVYTTPPTYKAFSVYVGAVQRLTQLGADRPVVLTVVALTPDDTKLPNGLDAPDPVPRLHAERLTRLEDLTGGSALARFANKISNDCEGKNTRKAEADLLWVVDDSGSMQQLIKRLQRAAREARAVLTTNAAVVDYRVAMTTTNPSPGARGRCFGNCNDQCQVAPECPANTCADAALGCLLLATPDAIAVAADVAGFPLPGGGGTFYYERSQYLDCDGRNRFIQWCGAAPYSTEFDPFFGSAAALTQNAGFFGSDPAASCTTQLMDLSEYAAAGGTSCDSETVAFCCPRLVEGCTDGPRLLESQMCDLIRSMGGLPSASGVIPSGTGRPHASPEMGTRSARRLLERMLPAYPKNSTAGDKGMHLRRSCCSTCDPGVDQACKDTCCTPCDPALCPADDPDCCSHPSLDGGYDCNISSGCGECTPGEAGCDTIPLVTLFLSDEEDFWFKDECAVEVLGVPTVSNTRVDLTQLPSLCRYADGDPKTLEPCTAAYCDSQGYALDPPWGYNPDQTAWTNDANARFNSLKPRPACFNIFTQGTCDSTEGCTWNAAVTPQRCEGKDKACSPYLTDTAISCVGDPCPNLPSVDDCNAYGSVYSDSKYNGMGLGAAMCTWDAGRGTCRSVCTNITYAKTASSIVLYDQLKAQCESDARCQWDPSQFNGEDYTVTYACQLKVELNDCRPCKRLRRLRQAIGDVAETGITARCSGLGEAACKASLLCEWTGSCVTKILPGLGAVGPAYAIVRDKGEPGAGKPSQSLDECNGGWVTWGRGDGTAYRDIAIATQGRTQNVCAESYKDFMQAVITDITTLSAPYRLAHAPIASTLKVGIARPDGAGGYTYYDVPRSLTQGFVYNPTTNSLGFKRDPIDGDCRYGPLQGSCTAGDGIEESEIQSALNLPYVPQQRDILFISYRYWLPVPCRNVCDPGETCSRVLCAPGAPTMSCAEDIDCPDVNDECVSNQCACAPNTIVDRCVPEPCEYCTYFDPTTGTCKPVVAAPGECACNVAGLSCWPGGPDVCPVGQRCDETNCVCVGPVNPCPGVNFDSAGTFPSSQCDAAIQCCEDWADAAVYCGQFQTSGDCEARVECKWALQSGRCISAGPAPCCNPTEEILCYPDPETQRGSIQCDAGACICLGDACSTACAGIAVEGTCNGTTGCAWNATANPPCRATACQAWQTCGTDGRCTPACHPVNEYCEVRRGCICLPDPG